ncbi:HYR domain-containing protein [Algoriphagus marinus]|uniref:HYR domain-containing protein n=1 Tax=Algoriphagus marinus TaxID=1925762 RepID=UPI00158822D8|nr:HYR domain-containing protein [Algoriphagus marinus]
MEHLNYFFTKIQAGKYVQLFVGIFFLFFLNIGSIQAQELFFYSGAKKISLKEDRTSSIIQFKENTNVQRTVSSMRSSQSLKDVKVHPTRKRAILTFDGKQNLNSRQLNSNFFTSTDQIASTSFAYLLDGGMLVWPTDQVLLKFKRGSSIEALESLMRQYQATYVRTDHEMVILKIENIQNALELSNLIYESGFVEWAHPDFYAEIIHSDKSNTLKDDNKVTNNPLFPDVLDPIFSDQFQMNNSGQTIDGFPGLNDADCNALEAWDIATGSSEIIVAVIDDGVEEHEDLGNVLSGYTPARPLENGRPVDSSPDNKHGQAVSGIIAALHNGIGVMGVAPAVKILPINIFTREETLSDYASAFTWAADNGADVINNSWGFFNSCSFSVDAIDAAIQYAVTEGRGGKGSIVVFASGNGTQGCVDYPANNPNVIAVGAFRNTGLISSYSNQGTALDITAPSNGAAGVRTTDRMGAAGYSAGNYTNTFGGTSAACPVVSGVAALVLSMNADLTDAEVKKILYLTAIDMGTPGRDNTFGHGRVNAFASVIAADPTNTPPVAVIIADPTSGDSPLVVNFDASGSSDADNDALTYTWDFGDGNIGSGLTTSHTYTTPGWYDAVLIVSDGKRPTEATVEINAKCPDNNIIVELELVLDLYPEDTSWQIKDATGGIVASGGGYTIPYSVINQQFCLPAGCYDFVIVDSFGDGINAQGDGLYKLTQRDKVLASSDGNFGRGETKNFCLDTEVPVFAGCPADIEVPNGSGTCEAVVSWTPPTATDTNGSVTLVSDFEPGTVFPVGETLVTYTATDLAGNKSTCSFSVKVNDTNPPVPPASPETLNLQCIGDVPAPYELTATDNCSGEITVMPTVTQQSTGPTSVSIKYRWTFIDASGNAVFAEQIINVIDNLAPVPPVAPADLILQCVSEIPAAIELTAIDNCDGEIKVFPTSTLLTSSSTGFELIYTWTFVDASGNSSSISQKIIVKDNTAPVPPAAPEDLNLQCASEVPAPETLTAIDNCSGSITVSPVRVIIFGASPNDFEEIRTWTFVDNDGNSSSVSQRIVVKDNIPPTITCLGDINETVAFGETGKVISYNLPAFGDNCGGASLSREAGLESGSIFPLGKTIVTYRATDPSGNFTECSFDVIVTEDADAEDPEIANCPDNILISNAPGTCGATVTWTAPTASDNSGSADLESNFEPGDFFPVGKTLVIYTATDGSGNKATCSFEVIVADVELPVLGSVFDINVSIPSTQSETNISITEPSVSDNCSAIVTGVRSDGKPLSAPYPVGETTITWSAEDPSGNDALEVQQIVIVTQTSNGQKVTRFVLVNSRTNQDLFEIIEGMEIDADLIEGLKLNIRAEADPNSVGSVFLRLTGARNVSRTESAAPYAIFGDVNGNYFDGDLVKGNYVMFAVPYSLSGRRGVEGDPLTVNFSIVEASVPVSGISVNPGSAEIILDKSVQLTATIQPSNASNKAVTWSTSNSSIASVNSNGLVTGNAAGEAIITATSVDGGFTASATIKVVSVPVLGIQSFTLVNSGTNQDLFELLDGSVINQSQINGLKLNVRANTNPEIVGSVYFTLSGPVSTTRTESAAPYALFGDRNGNYFQRTLPAGNYTLTAIPYSLGGRRGVVGEVNRITFTITDTNEAFRKTTETGNATGSTENKVMEKEIPNTMEDQGPDTLIAFPNPIKDGKVSIRDSKFERGTVKYVLYSANGMKLREGETEIGELKTIRLDFSGNVTQAGMYILVLDTDNYLAPKMIRLVFE